jgi:hypothetical protein
MGNRQSTIQYEKLIEHPIVENIKYSVDIPFEFDLVMYYEFSLNKIEYNFKNFIKTNECFDYRYKFWIDDRKANSEQRRLNLNPILKIKHLCDKDYTFEVYNADELILDTVVNLDDEGKRASYAGF